MQFEVVYPLPEEQIIFNVKSDNRITIREAIVRSGVLDKYPKIDINNIQVGIYGDEKPLDTILEDQDRVEIYRPLTISPIEARRIRAEKKRKSGQTSRFGA
jgi:hypothetical protein